MRQADWLRGLNRARINGLFNGEPPYEDGETDGTNVNFLEATKLAHDARRQFSTAFLTPDPLFTINLDYGPHWKKKEWGSTIQREMNKIVKSSLPYLELRRSTFASVVLHGIGPVAWENQQSWCPVDLAVEDVYVPSDTLLSMKNLPFFVVCRRYTVPELMRLTRGKNVDGGWNMPLVKSCLKWADKQSALLMGSSWSQSWKPELMQERIKGDGAFYASDQVETVDVFDFYFYDDNGKKSGWKRRMILDAWGNPGAGATPVSPESNSGVRKFDHGKGDFLYDSGDRIFADKLSEIIHFQFADGSSVAPFRYHSVRSLGYLLYAVCHLQNRLRSKFNDAVFESLLQYFRVSNPADMDRLMKINLVDKGVLEEGVQFVKPEERWQINEALVQQAMSLNRQTMAENSASFTQNFDFSKENSDETATRTMARVNSTTALVGAMLQQAYNYQQFQYAEIGRRFCIKDSNDLDVMKFRVRCLKAGVPVEALNVDAWDIQPVRVIGAGNKMIAVAAADKLMAISMQLDPTAQREVRKLYIAANSDDYDLADRLVPEQPHISDTIHDSELAFGAIMQGAHVTPKPGLNPQEVIMVFLKQIGMKVQKIMQTGGVGTPQDVEGLQAAAQYTDGFIKMLAQDKSQKATVAAAGKELGKIMNEVKAMAQRQQEQAQKAQQNGDALDPQAKAKIAAILAQSQAKIKIGADSHAAKTAQRAITFEKKTQQEQQRHALDIDKELALHGKELVKHEREIASTDRLAELKPAEPS